MELKVYIDGTHSGLHRIVSGVTETTTCQDIVYALAHATGQTGRFKLIERSRSSEKLLAPHENPLKILSDWGEYSNHVQFVLLRSESDSANSNDANKSQTHQQQQLLLQSHQQIIRKTLQQQQQLIGDKLANNTIKNNNVNGVQQNDHKKLSKQDGTAAPAAALSLSSTTSSSSPPLIAVQILERNKESRKSFGSLSDGKYNVENVGIVKGIPQQNPQQPSSRTISPPSLSPTSSSSSTRIASAAVNNIPPINTSTTSFHENIPISPIHSSNNSTASIELNSSVMTGSGGGGGDGAGTNSSSASSTLTTPIKLQQQQQSIEFNTADVRNSLERKTTNSNTNNTNNNNNNNNIFRDNKIPNNSINEQLFDSYNLKNCPPISSNGALVPPPYRDPPPPRTSPLHQKNDSFSNGNNTNNVNSNNNYNNNNNNNGNNNLRQFEFKENVNTFLNGKDVNELLYHNNDNGTTIAYQNAQCKELIQLIKFQRDKLNAQQADLTKFDAEILYLENRDREHLKQIDAMKREINISEQIYCETSEQLQTLQYVEEENELVYQQEKTIKSEITLLRSKLANCETELLQLKNKETLLQNDVDIEKRCKFNQNQQQQQQQMQQQQQQQMQQQQQQMQQQQQQQMQQQQQQQIQHQQQQQHELDNDIQYEIINMKADSMQLMQNSVLTNKTMENLKRELTRIESVICDKKKQVEQLVNEMKEVNLQSLAITPSEEIRHLLEGSNRQGSSRRIIGSPRQLETAVPTSKNPHGVWV